MLGVPLVSPPRSRGYSGRRGSGLPAGRCFAPALRAPLRLPHARSGPQNRRARVSPGAGSLGAAHARLHDGNASVSHVLMPGPVGRDSLLLCSFLGCLGPTVVPWGQQATHGLREPLREAGHLCDQVGARPHTLALFAALCTPPFPPLQHRQRTYISRHRQCMRARSHG
jgi:hypothetical protein